MARKLKSFVSFFLIVLLSPFTLSFAQGEKLNIIATVFPAFDFARTIAAGQAEVSLLLPPGSESHSYEPTPQDIITIQNADLFLYTGGDSDHWIEEILDAMGDDVPATYRMIDSVSLLEEETTQSMEHQHTHEHSEDCDHAHEESEMDEHVWTSPQNVMLICKELADVLCELSPQNASVFEKNLADYLKELTELDTAFANVVEKGKRDLMIFGDRFPLRYFAAAYGLRYDAAFPGCSEDSEPSVRTVISLIDTVRAEQIPVIFHIEFSSRRTADILAEETGAKPLLFHSCHNVSAEEIANGATYLSLMHQNVYALKEALN